MGCMPLVSEDACPALVYLLLQLGGSRVRRHPLVPQGYLGGLRLRLRALSPRTRPPVLLLYLGFSGFI